MFRRVWLLVAIVASVVLGPRLFTPVDGSTPDGEVVVVAAVAPDQTPASPLTPPVRDRSTSTVVLEPSVAPVPSASSVPPPAPESEQPAPSPSTTEATEATEAIEAEPEPAPPTTEAPAPPPTTTEVPPPPTTTAPPPPEREPAAPVPAALSAEHADGTQEGNISWYDLPGSISGVCAHRTIEKGTVVTVTNLDTGKSITCLVDDRGPYSGDGKVLDLHRDEFSQLAPLEQGIFPARLDW